MTYLAICKSFIEGAEEGGCKDKIQELVKVKIAEKIKEIEETRKTFNTKIEALENTDKYVTQEERDAIDTAKASKSPRAVCEAKMKYIERSSLDATQSSLHYHAMT